MDIRLSSGSGVPVYHQIRTQIEWGVASGRLSSGDVLPPIRSLASELGVNPNTVARAYRDLEQRGLLRGRRGLGTYVTDLTLASGRKTPEMGEAAEDLERKLDNSVAELVVLATRLGLSERDVLKRVEDRFPGAEDSEGSSGWAPFETDFID